MMVEEVDAGQKSDMKSLRSENDDVAVGDTEALKDLVRHDLSVSILQVIPVIASFFWNKVLLQRVKPLSLLSVYVVLAGMYYKFRLNAIVRICVTGALALPIICSAIFIFVLARKFVNNRHPAFQSAQDILMERIKVGRAKRKKDIYDLFLPPPSSTQVGNRDKKHGIIFFPGALVNHTSYASVASKLSDKGILVVVVSLEPIRFDNNTETNKQRALKAMQEVVFENDITVDEWTLSGHSAGAAVAMNLVSEMQIGINRMVLCGATKKSFEENAVSRNSNAKVLLVNASEDGIVKRASTSQKSPSSTSNDRKESKCKTTHIMIEGGNHAGFGHYGPQDLDGVRSITLEQQQAIFVEKTVEFLMANESGDEKEKEM